MIIRKNCVQVGYEILPIKVDGLVIEVDL